MEETDVDHVHADHSERDITVSGHDKTGQGFPVLSAQAKPCLRVAGP